MLKFDKIIHRLTLEEKVELLVSSVRYENSKIEDFNLPRFKINEASNVNLSALAATWDLDLIHDIAKETANLDNNHDSITINACSVENKIEYNANTFSQDKYANGRFAAAYLRGINDSGKTSALLGLDGVNPDNEELRREELLASEVAIKEGRPSVVIASSANNLDILRDEYDYKGEIMMDSQDVAKAFYNGCHFVFSTENPKEALLEAIKNYNEYILKLNNNEATKQELDELEREGKIFNPDKLDTILDHYLGFLYKIDLENQKAKPLVDDNQDRLIELSKKSIIMLKNDNVLPLDKKDAILICGAAAFSDGENSMAKLAEDTKLNIAGVAHAYSYDLLNDEGLIHEALNMAEAASCIVLCLDLENKKIPEKQMSALKAFNEAGKKVIAIVYGSGEIESDIFSLSAAVVQICIKTTEAIKAIFSLLEGKFNPEGRTAWFNGYEGIEPSLADKESYRYPIGYGLSLTTFEYQRMAVDKHGVSLTVKNTGKYPGSELVCLMIEYSNPDGVSLRQLRGFKKVYLKSNESERIFIDFDAFSFKSYNESNKCDEIKTGSYNLLASEGLVDVRLNSTIELKGQLLNPVIFSNEADECNDSIDLILDQFRDTTDRREFFNERKGLKFKTKMIILGIVFVYFNAMFIYIGADALPDYSASIAIFASIVAIFNIAMLILLILFIKTKNKNLMNSERSVRPHELEALVDEMNDYWEIGRVTYKKPVLEEPIVEEEAEEVKAADLEEKPLEEVEERKEYLLSDYDCDEGGIHFAEDIYPAEYVQAFNDYSSNNGIIIEPKSSRALFASLGSTHLLILNSSSRELLDKEASLVLSYLGNSDNIFDLEGKESLNDLLWEQVDSDTFRRTKLSGLLSNMRKLKNTCNIIVFKNPNMNSLRAELGSLIDFIINPNGDYYINLGTKDDEDLILIPKNLIIILEANDKSYLDSFDRELAERSLSVELQLRVNELEPIETPEIKYMSYKVFERISKECKSRNIIPEEYWKKLDDLEEEINNLEPFRLENKTILDFERFVGLMIEAGGDIDESIDMALAYRIVPILKSYNVYKNKDGDNTVYAIIERIFTAENTELTKRAIKKALE